MFERARAEREAGYLWLGRWHQRAGLEFHVESAVHCIDGFVRVCRLGERLSEKEKQLHCRERTWTTTIRHGQAGKRGTRGLRQMAYMCGAL